MATATADERAYIARDKCGCIVFATSATAYEESAATRKELAKCVRDGLAVDRMSVEDVREQFGHKPPCPRANG